MPQTINKRGNCFWQTTQWTSFYSRRNRSELVIHVDFKFTGAEKRVVQQSYQVGV